MSEQENQYNSEGNEKKWPLWWIVFPILLVMSLCASGFLYYKYYKSTHTADGQTYESIYKDAVKKHNYEKAELNRELEEIKAKLEEAFKNNTSLSDINSELEAKLDAKTLELAGKIKAAGVSNPKALREAKSEIDRLMELNNTLNTKFETLSARNRELLDKVLATETSVAEAQAKAQEMEELKNNLEEKVRNGNLSVADLKVVGVFKKGSVDEETFKANKIKKLKISFIILQNELVEPGNKDIVIRIIRDDKEVLTNDNDKLMDTEKLSTMTVTVDFQNDIIKTTIFYAQKASYKKGTYTIELLHKDKLMGRAAFILK
jgi:chromosome segregation ATPase